MTTRDSQLLRQFEAIEIEGDSFRHRQHVEVAFEMLDKYSFLEACQKYSNVINTMAVRAGAADKFNVTITFAFLSIIAERKAQMPNAELDGFLSANSDLLDKELLKGWYSDERLRSVDARRHFLLPDKPRAHAA